MKKNIPPFSITNNMLLKVASITEKITKLNNFSNLNKRPYLRKQTQINSIHSSLAIENNSLTIEQVKDVIDGKIVLGNQKEIQEVKNAYNAYELLKEIDPYSIENLKKIHGIMTFLTVDESGDFRKGDEGVFDGNKCIFLCPSPKIVNSLMNDLFNWMIENKDIIHPLILSSIFHYEFVFIHPFSDGNGRMVRLWQNVLLYNWNNIFEYIPIESLIYKYQDKYYKVIDNCNKKGDSIEFVEFMLEMIDATLDETIKIPNIEIDEELININKLLSVMKKNVPVSANELLKLLKIKSKITLRNKYLNPAIKKDLIKLTNPSKPNSKNQMYYKN